MTRSLLTVAFCLFAFSSSGNAAELVEVPGKAPIESSSFPENYDVGVRGVRLGMSLDDVKSVFEEQYGLIDGPKAESDAERLTRELNLAEPPRRVGFVIDEVTGSLKEDFENGYLNGLAIETEPFLQAAKVYWAQEYQDRRETAGSGEGWYIGLPNMDQEYFEILFGSPLTGSRVQSIRYFVRYREPRDLKVVLDTVLAKYGDTPSSDAAPGIWGFPKSAFGYLFQDGKQVKYRGYMKFPEDDRQLQRCLDVLERDFDTEKSSVDYYPLPHRYYNPVSDEYSIDTDLEVCNGTVQVGVNTQEINSVVSLEIVLEDKLSIINDSAALDEFFKDKLAEYLAKPGGSLEAPDL